MATSFSFLSKIVADGIRHPDHVVKEQISVQDHEGFSTVEVCDSVSHDL